MNSIEFFKVYTKKTTLTALSFVEKQKVLNFKAGDHFKNFYTDRTKFLRHKNTFKGSEKILEEQEKLNFVRKDMVNYKTMPKISARKRILCELLRLNFKLKNNIKKKRLWVQDIFMDRHSKGEFHPLVKKLKLLDHEL